MREICLLKGGEIADAFNEDGSVLEYRLVVAFARVKGAGISDCVRACD
jgi:predicted RNA polymerase sigma factor